jgi:hypothetical protein
MSTATERDRKHKDNILVKAETLDGLRALYQEWKLVLHPSDPYMRRLKQRIRKTESQLRNMGHEDNDSRNCYAKHYSRSHDAVMRVYDAAGNVIETHEHKGDFREW